MKKFFRIRQIAGALLAALGLVSCEGLMDSVPAVQSRTPSYLAMETYSGRILYSGNPNERRPIGMLANVATALVALDWINARHISMDRMLTVPVSACRWPQTNLLRLAPGDRISVRDALHSAIMWDDSACAATLAYACGSTINANNPEGAFILQMNHLGNMIGMKSTRFKGTSGAVITQSDANDMARLGLFAMRNSEFCLICSKRSHVAMVNGVRPVTIVNSNSMLNYASVNGVRAARSASAGACLLASVHRPSVKLPNPTTGREETYPQRLLIVILGAHTSQSRYQVASMLMRDSWKAWEDWQKMYDYTDRSKFILLPKL